MIPSYPNPNQTEQITKLCENGGYCNIPNNRGNVCTKLTLQLSDVNTRKPVTLTQTR